MQIRHSVFLKQVDWIANLPSRGRVKKVGCDNCFFIREIWVRDEVTMSRNLNLTSELLEHLSSPSPQFLLVTGVPIETSFFHVVLGKQR
jgi:hypothetical protein